jgi:hypothetical protein
MHAACLNGSVDLVGVCDIRLVLLEERHFCA